MNTIDTKFPQIDSIETMFPATEAAKNFDSICMNWVLVRNLPANIFTPDTKPEFPRMVPIHNIPADIFTPKKK